MKNIIVLLPIAIFCCLSFAKAQQTDDVGKIVLSVVMPENLEGLNASQLSKIESKIQQIASSGGLSASGYNNNFVIYPKFTIYETNVVETGMKNITMVNAELSLFIKQSSNNLLFSSISKPLKGTGSNKEQAITNAIAQLPVSGNDFVQFMETGKQKIVKYYETNCNNIVKKADSYIKMQQYEQALGLLMSIPEEVSICYDNVLNKSIEAFKAYQNQHCSELLQQAKAKSADMDYSGALLDLSQIDPASKCYKEQQTVMKSIENKVSAEDKKQWDFIMKAKNDETDLEKQRINAIKEIAVSYYNSQNAPSTIVYETIVK